MPSRGFPGRLALRVLDNNTGAEVVRDLQYAHDCHWEVRALQQGMPGSSALGRFSFHSPGAARAQEMKRWRVQWDAIAIGQRVEAYLGNVSAGTPQFTGIITDIKRRMEAPWEVTGVDSLWQLQQTQCLPQEVIAFATNAANVIAYRFVGGVETVWDDDFSGGSTDLTNNYNISGWSATTDPVFGFPAVTA